MSEPASVGTVSERLHALDLVRSMALLLGILYHAALAFIPDYEFWLVMDSQRSWPIDWVSYTLHSFRMVTFFLLAGFFAHMMLHRKGTSAFAWDRTKRILFPLLVFIMPVLFAFLFAMEFAAAIGADIMELPPAEPSLADFDLTHLWFLWVLFLIYAVILVLRAVIVWLDRNSRFRLVVDNALARILEFPFALPILLAVPVGFLLQHYEPWTAWLGIPTPNIGFIPNATAFLSYFLAFAVGYLIHRLKRGLTPLAGQWLLYIPTALVVTVASIILSDGPSGLPPTDENDRLVQAALYGLMIWLWTFGLIGLALRFIRKESPTVRYLADSSYWLYIIHLPLLIALQAVVQKWELPAELKLLLVMSVAMVIMLATYHLLVRFTWLGGWINGKRYRRRGITA